ncbi:probable salivary secreted peptide [Colletes gigas]|uniref:probable salivary secreted peptide n=1 Tax=Colletes gigas TaxID=935657 RepID=UPI001C9BA7B0|nr:probable salivary secreted peptide [Colletes gigas]
MSAQKVLVCLAIIAVAMLATQVDSFGQPSYANNATNKSHNLVIGYRMPGDRLVLRQSVVKNSSWMQIVTDQKSVSVSKFYRISMINARDMKTDGNGAFATLVSGGLGFNNATLRFKSQRGHGINFVLEVYARG